MPGATGDTQRRGAHRRGVILGLTVAEFMIVMTFLVLTAAVTTIRTYHNQFLDAEKRAMEARSERDHALEERARALLLVRQTLADVERLRLQVKQAQAENARIQEENARQSAELTALMKPGQPEPPPALSPEVQLKERDQRIAELARELADLRGQIPTLTAENAALLTRAVEAEAARLALQEGIRELTARLEKADAERAEVLAQQQDERAKFLAELDWRQAERVKLFAELDRWDADWAAVARQFNLPEKATLDTILQALRLPGSGTVPGHGRPHCWPNGGPDADPLPILRVTMLDGNSVEVSDVTPRPHPDDPAWAALNRLTRGRMPMSAFLAGARPVLSVRRPNGCVYAIEAIDAMSNDKKAYTQTLDSLRVVFFVQMVKR